MPVENSGVPGEGGTTSIDLVHQNKEDLEPGQRINRGQAKAYIKKVNEAASTQPILKIGLTGLVVVLMIVCFFAGRVSGSSKGSTVPLNGGDKQKIADLTKKVDTLTKKSKDYDQIVAKAPVRLGDISQALGDVEKILNLVNHGAKASQENMDHEIKHIEKARATITQVNDFIFSPELHPLSNPAQPEGPAPSPTTAQKRVD